MTAVLTQETLTTLLQKAAEAHHPYEQKLGHYDNDWPVWYAGWVVNHLDDQGAADSFVQGNARERDFTPTGIRVEQPYENDRNGDSKKMLKAIIKEVFGTDESMVGHHISFETHDLRVENGKTVDYTITQEYPSIDTLIFDHAVAQKLWGARWKEVVTQLVLEPTATRDALFAKLYYGRNVNAVQA